MKPVRRMTYPGNPLVNLVLDQILDVSQIDPSSINPTDKLGRDLGLTPNEIQTVVWKCAQKMSLPINFDSCQIEDVPVAEIVEILKSWSNEQSRMSA